jgi:predicted Zn-dependent peptidase
MKVKFFLLTVLMLLLSINAQVDRSKMPEPGPAPEIQLGDFQSFQLDNGLKVFVVENNKLPRVTFRLVIDRDPIIEGENAGYVQLAGNLLRTGTTNRSKDQIDEEVDFIGADLFTTSSTVTGIALKKHVNSLLDIMSDVVLNADFKQEELDKLKKQTISGLKAEKDDPNAIAGNVRRALSYGLDHPYGEQTTEETVNNITLEMCKNYYDTYFKPNAAYLAVVGDITFDEAKELVEKYFADWKKGEIPSTKIPKVEEPLVTKVALVDRPNAVQSVINVAYPLNLTLASDDAIKARVLGMILGGYFSSRVNQNLREDKGWTYGARASIGPDKIVGNFIAGTEARNSVTDSVVTEILNELKKLRNEKVSAEELESAKKYLIGSFARSLESPQTIAEFALNIQLENLPEDYYKTYLQKVNSVTVEDIQATAKKYLKPDNAYVIVVGKAEEVAESLKKFSLSGKVNYYDMYGKEYDPSVKNLPEGVTTESVIEKYIEVVGGREKLSTIVDQTIVYKGKAQGMDITLTAIQKVPNKLYQELDASVFKQLTVYDGEKGAVIVNGQSNPLAGDQLETLKNQSMLFPFLDYSKHGITAELKGLEKVDGKEAFKVELTMTNGDKSTNYYDKETGLLIQQQSTLKTPQGAFTQTISLSDYKDFDGVKVAQKLVQSVGPMVNELTLTSAQFNTDVADSKFEVK